MKRAAYLLVHAVCAGLLAWPSAASAQWVTAHRSAPAAGEQRAKMSLSWPEPVTAQVRSRPSELVVRVDRPLRHAAFASASKRLAPWIRGVFVGYDTVSIRLAAGTTAVA